MTNDEQKRYRQGDIQAQSKEEVLASTSPSERAHISIRGGVPTSTWASQYGGRQMKTGFTYSLRRKTWREVEHWRVEHLE